MKKSLILIIISLTFLIDLYAEISIKSLIGKPVPDMPSQSSLVKTENTNRSFGIKVGRWNGKQVFIFSKNITPDSSKANWIVLDAIQAPMIPKDYEYIAGTCEHNDIPNPGSMKPIIGGVKFDYENLNSISVETYQAWKFDFKLGKFVEIDKSGIKCFEFMVN